MLLVLPVGPPASTRPAEGDRAAPASAALPAGIVFHSLRHRYASLCVAAGLDYMAVCRFMGYSKPITTLAIYTHLFNVDDHADAMAALGAMAAGPKYGTNVVPLHG